MAPARTAPSTPPTESHGFPRRPGLIALVAAALFVVVVLDTVWRGPLTWGLDGVNDGVSGLRDAGWPVHEAGRWMSVLGEYVLCGAFLAATVLAAIVARRPATAWAVAATWAASMLFHWGSQRLLSHLNVPMERLDPYLVPDAHDTLRVAGEHLFPSGHTFIATVGWGMLGFVAIPLALQWLHAPAGTISLARRAGIVQWILMVTAVGVGRILRQAHGYNDVLAGVAAGCALLFGGLWLANSLEPRHERRAASTGATHGADAGGPTTRMTGGAPRRWRRRLRT